ncbi:hypothetical protein G9A89_017555 [Geosiphon pyriformis]|nr:hypothetical protein G9A89_017555 [Geosiphon pyriformis]
MTQIQSKDSDLNLTNDFSVSDSSLRIDSNIKESSTELTLDPATQIPDKASVDLGSPQKFEHIYEKDETPHETIYMVTHHIVHHRLEIPVINPPLTPPRKTWWQKLRNGVRKLTSRLLGRIHKVEDSIDNTIHKTTEKVSHAVHDAKDAVQDKIHSAEYKISDAIHSATDKIQSAEHKITAKYETAKENLANQKEKVKDALRNAEDSTKEKLFEAKDKAAEFVQDVEEKAQIFGQKMKEVVTSPFRAAREKVFKAAKKQVRKTANTVDESIADQVIPPVGAFGNWWAADKNQNKHSNFEEVEWRPTRNAVGNLVREIIGAKEQISGAIEGSTAPGKSMATSAFYCAIFVLYFVRLRVRLWNQRKRTSVYVGDGTIEMLKAMQDSIQRSPSTTTETSNLSAEDTTVNGASPQQLRMNVTTSKITMNQASNSRTSISRSLAGTSRHRPVYQAPSARDYENLMKLVEACTVYTITVPIGILLLSFLEMNGIQNTLLHVLYIILGYATLLHIHGGLFGTSREFILGRKDVAQQIAWAFLIVVCLSCGWIALSSVFDSWNI